MTEELVIKSVYCNYRGYLIVYDIHGKKVHELSGELTLEKYEEIEKRRADIPEFDGLDHYRRIVSEKKEEWTLKRVGTVLAQGQQSPQSSVSEFTIENTSKKTLPVVLFGAVENMSALNYGNVSGIMIDKPNDYALFLARSIQQPLIVKMIQVANIDKTNGTLAIKRKNAFGATAHNNINIIPNALQQIPSVVQHSLNQTLDGTTEFGFDLAGNSKVHIKLFH